MTPDIRWKQSWEGGRKVIGVSPVIHWSDLPTDGVRNYWYPLVVLRVRILYIVCLYKPVALQQWPAGDHPKQGIQRAHIGILAFAVYTYGYGAGYQRFVLTYILKP